jgi:hypothetical protein
MEVGNRLIVKTSLTGRASIRITAIHEETIEFKADGPEVKNPEKLRVLNRRTFESWLESGKTIRRDI